jgi:hypothetical protein
MAAVTPAATSIDNKTLIPVPIANMAEAYAPIPNIAAWAKEKRSAYPTRRLKEIPNIAYVQIKIPICKKYSIIKSLENKLRFILFPMHNSYLTGQIKKYFSAWMQPPNHFGSFLGL